MKFLENNRSRVALTTNRWTASSQKKGYMAITAHFIDDSWVLQSRLLSIGGRHVGPHRFQIHENLLEALMCTQDWLWMEDKYTPIDAKVLENVLEDRDPDDESTLAKLDEIR
ncbi:uncharacterized protein LOC120081507 [Benincasa hispida]|uniref:uncharacterized protein LOC120081507 n=1 Tax=Benincasa hispida TaxID=102211 RepID=UPI001901B990|nr:uncharacterized protein LOC120081507 [Benincasa hispida]XP_038892394.1 uncharacterized protein LOC120081507 [Benincasa hispida]